MTKTVDIAWEKVKWATDKRDALNECLSDYKASKPSHIHTTSHGKQMVKITEQPPIKISIILGEMVYQFRSALDHLFFELVVKNHANGQLKPGWEHHCKFPINTKLPAGCAKPPVPRVQFNCGVRNALTDDAFSVIEEMQPYYPWGLNSSDLNKLLAQQRLNMHRMMLRLLNMLSNVDKHRCLNTTVLLITHTQTAVSKEGGTSTGIKPSLDNNSEIEQFMYHPFDEADVAEVSDDFIEQVYFQEGGDRLPAEIPIELISDQFPSFMFHVMIPLFERLIDNR